MNTLADAFAERHSCRPEAFRRAAFRATLHRRAFLLLPFLWSSRYFDVDRELIDACGRARSLREIHEALVDWTHHPKNSSFARRWLRICVSTTRLKRFAKCYLTRTVRRADDEPCVATRLGASPKQVPTGNFTRADGLVLGDQ